MRFPLALAFCMFATVGVAQQHSHQHNPSKVNPAPEKATAMPKEAGQSAFAAIQEIVQILEADPKTDWAKVDIEGLRQHLIDMNNVTLLADVKSEATSDTVKFTVTGTGNVQASIQRMIVAHVDTMNGVNSWTLKAEKNSQWCNADRVGSDCRNDQTESFRFYWCDDGRNASSRASSRIGTGK